MRDKQLKQATISALETHRGDLDEDAYLKLLAVLKRIAPHIARHFYRWATPDAACLWAKQHGATPDTRAVACRTPQTALAYARIEGPHAQTREAAAADPKTALTYAIEVDAEARVTRRAVRGVPEYAYLYALQVDARPADDTRVWASFDPEYAFSYSRNVDRQPHRVTRLGACADSHWALYYALYTDRAPHPDTRYAAATSPQDALDYALEVDRGPHFITRSGAIRGVIPEIVACSAYYYALSVDEGYTLETWAGVQLSDHYRELYVENLGHDMPAWLRGTRLGRWLGTSPRMRLSTSPPVSTCPATGDFITKPTAIQRGEKWDYVWQCAAGCSECSTPMSVKTSTTPTRETLSDIGFDVRS